MASHHDPFLRRVNIPIGRRYGRQVGWRDRLLGLAFIAALLFGFWWILLRPTSYSVARQDLAGVLNWTDSKTEETHHEFYGRFGSSDVIVIVGIGNHFGATTDRALELQVQMRLEHGYPNATTKRFSNAIVVCGEPDDCSGLASRIESKARERESKQAALDYLK